MSVERIIAEIDSRIAQLQRAKLALAVTATGTKRKPGRPKAQATLLGLVASVTPGAKRRSMSAAARKKIAAAQKARWAAFHAKSRKK